MLKIAGVVPQPSGLIRLVIGNDDRWIVGEDYATWAADALTEGYDSPGLRKLAGLSSPVNGFDAHALFEQASRELGLRLPTPEEARRAYLMVIATGIADGTIAPEEALDVIHRTVISPLRHPADLQPWCYLWEGLEPNTFASLEGEALHEAVRRLAQQMVTRSPPRNGWRT